MCAERIASCTAVTVMCADKIASCAVVTVMCADRIASCAVVTCTLMSADRIWDVWFSVNLQFDESTLQSNSHLVCFNIYLIIIIRLVLTVSCIRVVLFSACSEVLFRWFRC